ncbi:LPS export ABC transporter periplasmic protein LptC [Pontibacter sp. JH31]|uniref:LPS export ABC transporter periplasmic protein LptC n=1 Tax=Pontibacter aquaedesilientis TaxID=2766980 RepID=A0ABR7XEU3_9BACT|nr:OstA-like protein [Pontibacter aquaedesilientis]MBD1396792.1 LPS export ABC transporter periplasmic protein LptC [Pontibacter aquaedesilientis]
MNSTKLVYSILFTLLSLTVLAQQRPPVPRPVQQQSQNQQQRPQQQPQSQDRVELQSADSLEGGTFNGRRINKLLGNVVFKQKETFLYADSVYKYTDSEILEAFGNVRINQADTVTMTGTRATYDGAKRTAKMSGGVTMKDPRMTLTTPTLDYNLENRTAVYAEGGTIVDPENRLQSQRGTYDTNTKVFTFQQNVKVFSTDYEITAQNMRYNTESKVVYFQGPTYIKGQSGDLYAEQGTYNTITKISRFGRNAYILTPEYRLGGDDLYYDEGRGYGEAKINMTMRSLKDDVTIKGQLGRYWRDQGVAKVSGSPVLETILDGDTLYMSADSLISREAKVKGQASMVYAFNNVKIYKSDLQGTCDSLSYNRTDSLMYMHKNPTLWSEQSQIVGDTIRMHLRNKMLDRMYVFSNSFIASEDSLKNYNQVKGRDMVAYFKEGRMRRVNVNGNGESIYFALEGDTTLTGMNKAVCSDMVLNFAENKLKSISFLVNPDASFIPPHELQASDRRLEGFAWLNELRPDKKAVLAPRQPVKAPAIPAKGKASPAKKKASPAPSKKATAKPVQQTPARQ